MESLEYFAESLLSVDLKMFHQFLVVNLLGGKHQMGSKMFAHQSVLQGKAQLEFNLFKHLDLLGRRANISTQMTLLT